MFRVKKKNVQPVVPKTRFSQYNISILCFESHILSITTILIININFTLTSEYKKILLVNLGGLPFRYFSMHQRFLLTEDLKNFNISSMQTNLII